MLGVNLASVSDVILVKRAVVVYAVYRATNQLRHAPSNDSDLVKGMLLPLEWHQTGPNHDRVAILDRVHPLWHSFQGQLMPEIVIFWWRIVPVSFWVGAVLLCRVSGTRWSW